MKTILAALLLATTLTKPTPPADLAAPPAEATRADDGLVWRQLAPGSGTAKPAEDELVKVRFTVWRPDGTLVEHVPAPRFTLVPLTKLLPGLRATVAGMLVGEQRRAWIPEKLASGKPLVIDVELVEIVAPPATPADVAAPPADATRTKSGLAYKSLRPGTGTEKPKRRNTVVVHYTGWTTDGQMFDSSVLRGETAAFPLTAVIPGWTEGLQLMTEGEVMRFWIPAKLAYGNEPDKPRGMLVFDIELVDIK